MENNFYYKNNENTDSKLHDLICFLAKKIQANTELDFEKVYDSFDKLDKQKNIDIYGFPSLILKVADWRRQIPEKLFHKELGRIDRGGNLGISFSDALRKFNELDNICFDNIRQYNKDNFREIIRKRIKNEKKINNSSSSVWIPMVDESNYVWFGKCSYDSENFLPYFMKKGGDCPQIDGESYKLGEEVAKRLSVYTKSKTKVIVTGVCDDFTGIVSAVNQEKFELKIERSLDFGADYILVPKYNFEKSNLCKKSKNIIPLSNLDELNGFIHPLAMNSIDLDRINKLDDKIYEPIKIYNEANKRSCGENMTYSIENKPNEDFQKREKECLTLFTNLNYIEAYDAYVELMEDFSSIFNNDSQLYLKDLLNMIKCEDYLYKIDLEKYKEVLKRDLEKYKIAFDKAEKYGNPKVVIEFFEITSLFYLNLSYKEGFNESYNIINSFYKAISYKLINNINDLHIKWLNSISDSRFYFSKNGRSNLLLDHCNSLYNSYANKMSIDNKVKLLDLMAETEYFSGTLNADSNAYNNIIYKLDEAIKLKPNDVFAEQLRKRVKEMKISDLQIRRFRHDSNSKLGDLKNSIKNIEENNNLPEELQNEFANIKFGIDSLVGIHYVSMEKMPSTSDWASEDEDITNYIKYYFNGKGLKPAINFVGKPSRFDYCEKYLSVVLDNLIKNAEEAYDKKNTPKGEREYEITINYNEFIVIIRDFAGGIAPEIKDKLFDAYASTKEEVICDCGLGLYQAKKAMNLQEGCDIRLLDPQPENGAAFVLDFKGE